MHYCIAAAEIARKLTARGHTNSLTGPTWRPGHRATQASPKTVRIWHDGPDEQQHLDQYAEVLRAAGYTVTAERSANKRPRIKVTKHDKEK
ncbi:hypothetical protein ABTX71_12890 [Streptomyces parvulus]|uniref:hypothetical protein n=1 Tax=Streptomyces parvulus TaxID=146923 RepID=UPI00331FC92D